MCVCVDDSFQKLESLDPQKRVQLEARIMGRRGSEVSPAQRGSEFSPDKSSSCGASRKRGLDNHSKQGVCVCVECVWVCVCGVCGCVGGVCVCVCVEWAS